MPGISCVTNIWMFVGILSGAIFLLSELAQLRWNSKTPATAAANQAKQPAAIAVAGKTI